MKKSMKSRVWLILGLLHWLISLGTDKLILTCETPWIYIIWKAVFFVFILAFWQLAGYLVREYCSGNEAVRRTCRYAVIYFAVMLVFLLLTWPGIWRVDEFTILNTAKNLHIHFWQGYLTSVYYFLCLMMIPAPVSVIIFMCLINAFIVGYLVYKLWTYTGGRKISYLLYLPFFFFPVIDSNLYPMRMSIYAFLELLLLAKICFWAYEKRIPEKREMALTIILAGIVTCWRSESIYYLVCFPIGLLIFLWKRESAKRIARVMICYVALAAALVSVQKIGEGQGRSDGYELTSIIRPLTVLVLNANYEGETDLLEDVDKVVNLAYIYEGAAEGKNGLAIFWDYGGDGLLKEGQYDREDYANYKKAYYRLILRHPMTFLRERWSTYWDSVFLLGDINAKEPPSNPINAQLRKWVYCILEFRSFEDYDTQNVLARIVYNSIPPTILLAAAAVILLFKKKIIYLGCVLLVLVKVPLVFLTSPGTLFMYYYSPYLCGWALAFFAGILLWVRHRSGRGSWRQAVRRDAKCQ